MPRQWEGFDKEPHCKRCKLKNPDFVHEKDSGPLKDIKNGYCKTPGDYYEFTATYPCKDGYKLYGGDVVQKCQDDVLVWQGTTMPKGVYKLQQPVLMHVYHVIQCYERFSVCHCKITGQGYQSIVTYSCDDGPDTNGRDRIRKCLNNGCWCGKEPQCI